MDAEAELYKCLAKMKNAGTYNLIAPFTSQTIELYMKRFGNKEYAKSISEEEFTEQLLDCINHIVAIDKNAKKLFDSLESEEERVFIIATISGIMIE